MRKDVREWLAEHSVPTTHRTARVVPQDAFDRLIDADPMLANDVAEHLGEFRCVDRSDSATASVLADIAYED
jgi:hypothetical protein